MDVGSNSVLVTGGTSGIGLALARRFLAAGSRVLICGRRADLLAEVAAANPGMETRRCDLSTEQGRVSSFEWVSRQFPEVNVLVNNAGIQRRVDVASPGSWRACHEEIAINLEAPIHLSMLFLPLLRRRERAAILNVTSGLAFTPIAAVPVYCATKAAMHSFTLSLRRQLRGSAVEVVEIIPPAVDTDLGGPGLHKFGTPLEEFADAAFAGIAAGEPEVAYGFAREARGASREQLDRMFERMNSADR